ncbi:MAG TPA: hypothetical protein VHH52_02195 [Pseudonocardiaceae bacterium]|nr:hypothetical protein [Pseudonocardiaceae bacterium]
MARQSSGIPAQRAEPLRARNRLRLLRRSRTARLEADFLDRLVDAELEFLRQLPAPLRDGPAEALAVLVMLAQDYRYYALGWINRRELRHRAERALTDLDVLRRIPGAQPLPANTID